MITTFRCAKAAVYHNTDRLTPAQIKAKTGCTHIINGWVFNSKEWRALSWLVIDGAVISKDQYLDWGFSVGEDGKPVMDTDRTRNFISAVPILKDGQKLHRDLTPDVARRAERTAVGWLADGRTLLWCDREKLTREELQDKLLELGCVDALMLDGGGSVQGIFPDETLYSSRRVVTLLLFWAETDTETTPEEENTMFKIALGAGHGIGTAGKRCLKALDPNETREWWLNDRICDYVENGLKEYEGYSLLRLDDSDDGKTDVSLNTRVSSANKWGADFYLSIHHNAGINGGSGGGIVAYTHPNSSKASVEWRDALYDALIANTGLKGNRSAPKATSNLQVLRETNMPAVLLEMGFMDSKTDVPVILTDEYARKSAEAIVSVIVKRGKLTRKAAAAPNASCQKAIDKGVFVGDGQGDYRWADPVTRSELCIVLDRLGLL